MPKQPPACELRERTPGSGDPYDVSFKVYAHGRLKGAILPIKNPEGEARWEALNLRGESSVWRYRSQARDYLCGITPDATAKA
jgi:hypothetical protein